MATTTIILAAGQGTRMQSSRPKILHKIADKALLEHVVDTSRQLQDNKTVVVYGHGAEQVLQELQHLAVQWIEQEQQLGTGHAVQQAVQFIGDDDTILILYGDVPLLKLATVQGLLQQVGENSLGLLTVDLDDPSGYGRIIRDENGQVIRIVEDKDASPEQKAITEGNTGIIAVNGRRLKNWLTRLENDNAQGEYYLTDIIEMAVEDGMTIATAQPDNADEVLGINDRRQLAHIERAYQRQQAEALMSQGVSFRDPQRFDLRGTIKSIGRDVEIDVNVVLSGEISIGSNVKIGANCCITDTVIEDDVEILPNCVIENSFLGAASCIGPFARLRPGARLDRQVKVGNFVEIKKSRVAQGSKINHLSYIGDTLVGSGVNIGAGTITCNYDGVNKHQTIIEDGAFIGSNTQLVAPVTVGKNATIGAGSIITRAAPTEKLTLTRAKQVSVEGWQRPVKQEK